LPPVASHLAVAHASDGNFRLPAEGVELERLEKSLLTQALERAHNNQTRAAQLLGISRHTLRYRLEKHGLTLTA
jgi:DNA-binding NtrC family response regulator